MHRNAPLPAKNNQTFLEKDMFLLQLDGNPTLHRSLCSPNLSTFSISLLSSVAEPITPAMRTLHWKMHDYIFNFEIFINFMFFF